MAIKDTSLTQQQLPLLSLNHVSFVCKSVARSVEFYSDVLGFASIRRPSSFDFKGAWYVLTKCISFILAISIFSIEWLNLVMIWIQNRLFSHGIGIHLLEMDTTPMKTSVINPKDNHISFQCTNMDLIIKKLEVMGIKYVTAVVKEGGVEVNQLFFHDPDGYMIEICNCHVLPMLPVSSPKINQQESFIHGMLKLSSLKFVILVPINTRINLQHVWYENVYGICRSILWRKRGINDGKLVDRDDWYFVLRSYNFR